MKYKYEIKPQIGFGPIKFGMSPKEVQAHVGKPAKKKSALYGHETDEEMIFYEAGKTYEWYGEKFPDDTDLQVTFKDDIAICITISKGSGPLMYKGMNLHIFKNRQQVLETLAKDEEVYYYDEVGYFFPKSGLAVPTPKHMRDLFFIQLFLTSYQRSRLEYDMYEPSTALS